jgi:hypothetical protein
MQQIALDFEARIKSMMVGGGISKWRTARWLISKSIESSLLRDVIPYMTVFKVIIFIMLPKKSHKKAREIFSKEVKKPGSKKEFVKWLRFALESQEVYKQIKPETNTIKKLYISGSRPYVSTWH